MRKSLNFTCYNGNRVFRFSSGISYLIEDMIKDLRGKPKSGKTTGGGSRKPIHYILECYRDWREITKERESYMVTKEEEETLPLVSLGYQIQELHHESTFVFQDALKAIGDLNRYRRQLKTSRLKKEQDSY
ncbi:hypothetical protein LXL04_025601 [Taraxacum kok-saghyz]